jgi:RimJ/RimL family protein N-acetyltransferase
VEPNLPNPALTGTPARTLEPVVLEGRVIRLVPMERSHLFPLADVGLDPSLWALVPTPVTDLDSMRHWLESALAQRATGTALPFVTVEQRSGKVVGSTRFAAWVPEHRRVEIGWTWVAPPWQRSAVNTEAKLLMLRHAFERLGCRRVELKTDALNMRSRAAILRLGAKEEGILRKHMITQLGRARDTVYFSITDDEWPAVSARLERMLGDVGVPPAAT